MLQVIFSSKSRRVLHVVSKVGKPTARLQLIAQDLVDIKGQLNIDKTELDIKANQQIVVSGSINTNSGDIELSSSDFKINTLTANEADVSFKRIGQDKSSSITDISSTLVDAINADHLLIEDGLKVENTLSTSVNKLTLNSGSAKIAQSTAKYLTIKDSIVSGDIKINSGSLALNKIISSKAGNKIELTSQEIKDVNGTKVNVSADTLIVNVNTDVAGIENGC